MRALFRGAACVGQTRTPRAVRGAEEGRVLSELTLIDWCQALFNCQNSCYRAIHTFDPLRSLLVD